jgi:uncharacterized membrane protein YecN with MAPEG domain
MSGLVEIALWMLGGAAVLLLGGRRSFFQKPSADGSPNHYSGYFAFWIALIVGVVLLVIAGLIELF